ncbi:MAG: DEAD/DEAH box helicase, partial [Candidatus Nanopelagicales bacterium]
MRLRDYQQAAIDKVEAAIEGGMRRPSIVLPTGAGKTIVFGAYAARLVGRGRRPMILVHRDELVRQSVAKIQLMAPGASIGVIQGTTNEAGRDITVASVQTLGRENRRDAVPSRPTDVIVDECHHATARSYMDILTWAGCFDPTSGATALGVTATMERTTGNRHLGDVWQDIVFTRDVMWMIRKKHLVDARCLTVEVPDLDMSGVKTTNGEYQAESQGFAIESSSAAVQVIEAWRRECPGKRTVLFAPTVATAEMFASEFVGAGISAAVVTGETPAEERQRIYRDLREGRLLIVCNCMVLTEGWDEPSVEVCIIARRSKSQPLIVQMIGRVLRRFEGKAEALVLAVVGAVADKSLRATACLTQSRKELKEGESVREAVQRWEDEESWVDPLAGEDAELKLTPVDLFGQAEEAWCQTPGGVWFLPTSKRVIFLWDDNDGTYRVGASQNLSALGNPPVLVSGGVDLGTAMDVGRDLRDDDQEDYGYVAGKKSAAWRKKPATAKQLTYAQSLGITYPQDETGYIMYGKDGNRLRAGEISDDIEAAKVG